MRPVLTASKVREMLQQGGPAAIPSDAILTPTARDLISEYQSPSRPRPMARAGKPSASSEPIIPDYEYKWAPGSDPSTPEEIARFFASPEITRLKERMVDIGQRIWQKGYVDGNGGNLTVRVGDNLVLCTPTLISKGFMSVEDICLVDLDGTQLAGTRKRTSEVNTHIGIMKRQPKAKSCVHAHPPHATAFAVASVQPPTCMIPEAEVFLGVIGLAPYQTPGSPENARTVGEMGVDHQSIIMENHGVICWGKDIEDAYWKMENTDAYCQTIWIASQLGAPLKKFGGDKLKELIEIRQNLGMDDPRAELKECELCDTGEFRPGVVCRVPGDYQPQNGEPRQQLDPAYAIERHPQAEAVVRQITDQIMARLG